MFLVEDHNGAGPHGTKKALRIFAPIGFGFRQSLFLDIWFQNASEYNVFKHFHNLHALGNSSTDSIEFYAESLPESLKNDRETTRTLEAKMP